MTPQQPAGVPQHIQIEMARRELKLLTRQRDVAAESIVALSNALAVLDGDTPTRMSKEMDATLQRLFVAVQSMIGVRLLELQYSHENLVARVSELEGALKIADSPIAMPGMRIK